MATTKKPRKKRVRKIKPIYDHPRYNTMRDRMAGQIHNMFRGTIGYRFSDDRYEIRQLSGRVVGWIIRDNNSGLWSLVRNTTGRLLDSALYPMEIAGTFGISLSVNE